jgi:nucleoside-diphosphate-sugar epimerase
VWWQGDLADRAAVDKVFARVKPEVVFHLASEVVGSREARLVLPTFNANLLSAVNVYIAATEHQCRRIITAGSLEEPGELDSAVTVPSSPYAAAKWAASSYARMFHALYQTPVAIGRLFMVYGPGQQDLRKLIPYVSLALLRGETAKLSSGQRPVDWIHVADIVEGLLRMGVCPGVEGKTFDLGSGELVTARRVVEMLCDIVDVGIAPDFGAFPDRPMEQIKRANMEAAREILGWEPAMSLRQGLEQTVSWYRTQLESGVLGA